MATTTVETAIVSAQVTAEQRDELRRLAARADRTLSAEVRRAVNEHLERERAESSRQP
jgi:hypothetical protein